MLLLNVSLVLLFALIGWLSRLCLLIAYGFGMILYFLDGLILLLFRDAWGIAFHGFALFSCCEDSSRFIGSPRRNSHVGRPSTSTGLRGAAEPAVILGVRHDVRLDVGKRRPSSSATRRDSKYFRIAPSENCNSVAFMRKRKLGWVAMSLASRDCSDLSGKTLNLSSWQS